MTDTSIMFSFRRYRDSLVLDETWSVHPDRSEVSIIMAKSQSVSTAIVDEEKYSEFVRISIEAQKEMDADAYSLLQKKIEECFDKIHPRSEQFAGWYFSFATSYKLIQEATLSLARHAAKVFEETLINEAVAADTDKFLTKKYQRIVLRREINNSELQSAYLTCIKEIHAGYQDTIGIARRLWYDFLNNFPFIKANVIFRRSKPVGGQCDWLGHRGWGEHQPGPAPDDHNSSDHPARPRRPRRSSWTRRRLPHRTPPPVCAQYKHCGRPDRPRQPQVVTPSQPPQVGVHAPMSSIMEYGLR